MAFVQARQPYQLSPYSIGIANEYIQRFQTGLYVQRNPLIAPGNRSDALIDGLNVEVSNSLTMQRRSGFDKYSTAQFGSTEIANQFWSWQDVNGNFHVITDTNTELADLQTTSLTSIFNKVNPAQASVQGVGATLYIAHPDGNLRWTGTGSPTTWGITAPSVAPTTTTSAGSLNPQFGYKWQYVYRDSSTGAVSSPSPLSTFQGPNTSVEYIVTVTGTAQTRVDKIDIYRTADGGSTYFFDGTVNNPGASTTTFTDNNPDTSLVLTQVAPAIGINNPPPANLTNLAFHYGRLWGSVGSTLFFDAGPDTLLGVPEESWPPLYFFKFPQTIQRLVPTPVGLLVWLPGQVWIIRGTSTTTFFPSLWQDRLGIRSYNSLFLDGDVMYVFTTDRQFVKIDQNGMLEMGFPIGTLISQFDPTKTFVTLFRQGTEENALYLGNGTDTYYRFNLNLQSWDPAAKPNGGLKVISSIETSAGVYNLLQTSPNANSFVFKRNRTIFADNLVSYASFFTVGSLMMAEAARVAEVQFLTLEYPLVGTIPTLYTMINELGPAGTATASTTGTLFVPVPLTAPDPSELPASQTIGSSQFHLKGAASILPVGQVRHMQVRVQWPSTDTVKNEIYSIGVLAASVK